MKLLIAGYGSVGQYLLDFIMKDHRICPEDLNEICIMSRKPEEEVEPRIEISRVAAGISDRFYNITYRSCDFNDIDKMSKIFSEEKPDIIVYTGRFVSGIKYGAYSYPKEIGYGVWSPLSIVYIYKLMQAVNNSGINCKVINTSFPDLTNYVLCSNGYNVYCGAGNLNHVVPRIKRAVSKLQGFRRPDEFEVKLVATHYFNTYVSKEGTNKGCPFSLTVYNKSTLSTIVDYTGDMSDYLSGRNDFVKEILKNCKDNSAGGPVRNQMVATDCAELVRVLVNKESEIFHVPGLGGRMGGRYYYFEKGVPYIAGRELHNFDLINRKGLELDGAVPYNGGIMFSEDSVKKMKEVYGVDYPTWVHLSEVEGLANKIVSGMGWE